MATCSTCGSRTSSGSCPRCVAAVVNYLDDPDMRATLHDNPAIRDLRRQADREKSQNSGCALFVLAAAAIPTALTIAGVIMANLGG